MPEFTTISFTGSSADFVRVIDASSIRQIRWLRLRDVDRTPSLEAKSARGRCGVSDRAPATFAEKFYEQIDNAPLTDALAAAQRVFVADCRYATPFSGPPIH